MTVRVALIGCGKVTQRLAVPQLSACRGARIEALVDINRQAAVNLANRFGLRKAGIWTDWERMLREAEVDAVAVNVPNYLHGELAVGALEAGKHVLIEKPIATRPQDAHAILKVARSKKRVVVVDQTLRYHPLHAQARKIVLQTKQLGTVSHLDAYIGHAGPEYWAGASRTWFTDRRKAGGGALIDIGVHIIDLMCWMTDKRVKRVFCQTALIEKKVRVEDTAIVLMEFTDDSVGTCQASWVSRPYEVTTHICGEKGYLRTAMGEPRPLRMRLSRHRGDRSKPFGKMLYPKLPEKGHLGGAYVSWIHAIQTGKSSWGDAEAGCTVLDIVTAAYRSARIGRWVNVPA